MRWRASSQGYDQPAMKETFERAPELVRAAGGVVVRDREGVSEVVIVHRPKYDDWTLPKGKAEDGESDEECALREVEEETGLACELVAELESSSYLDSAGRQKLVRYWLMRPRSGRLRPTREVDDARWLPVTDAAEQLTYPRDVRVLRSAWGN
jgi:8-oxo-dGTP pyrophosphatase MutT (NUDIX family)